MRAILFSVLGWQASCRCSNFKPAGIQTKPKKAASARSTLARSAVPRCPNTWPTLA